MAGKDPDFSQIHSKSSSMLLLDDDDPMATYYKRRKEIRESLGSTTRDSSVGILSLERMSLMDEDHNLPSLRMSEHIFKVPDVPSSRLENASNKFKDVRPFESSEDRLQSEREKARDILSRTKVVNRGIERAALQKDCATINELLMCDVSPKTPRVFRDELDSLSLEEHTPSTLTQRASLCDFPVRSTSGALGLFEADKKAIKAASELSHNSDISQFSDTLRPDLSRPSSKIGMDSIGEFFAKRSDDINAMVGDNALKHFGESFSMSATVGNAVMQGNVSREVSTYSDIRHLLADPQLTHSGVADKLLVKATPKWDPRNTKGAFSNYTAQEINGLSESRHSTPLADVTRPDKLNAANGNDDATPVKYYGATKKNRRIFFTSSSPHTTENFTDDKFAECNHQGNQSQPAAKTLAQPENSANSNNSTIRSELRSKPSDKSIMDCSSVTSLIRGEFPSIFLDEPFGSVAVKDGSSNALNSVASAKSGPWVHISPIDIVAELKTPKKVTLPVKTENRWLTMSVSSIEIATSESVFRLVPKEGAFVKPDVISVNCKQTALPPLHDYYIEMTVLCEQSLESSVFIIFKVQDMISGEIQEAKSICQLTVSSPTAIFSLHPMHHRFDDLPISCSQDQLFQLTHNGGEATLKLSLSEHNNAFIILNDFKIDGGSVHAHLVDGCPSFKLLGSQVLEFFIRFAPVVELNAEGKRLIELKNTMVVMYKTESNSFETVAQCDIVGGAAYGKFVPDSDFAPIVFRTSYKVPLLRSYHLTNVGAVPLRIGLTVVTDCDINDEDESGIFLVPKMITMPVNDSVPIEVTFSANCKDTFVRRFLCMQLQPNGRKYYIDLIGSLTESSDDDVKSSRSSIKSGTTSASTYDPIPIKLISSTNALSWAATPLHETAIQSFDVKIKSQHPATARIYFANETCDFKMINEKCEPESKCRKVLRPNNTTTLQVLFKPQTIGLHYNMLNVEFNKSTVICQLPLTAFGGCPNLRVEGTDSDVYGNKMVKLVHPSSGSSVYTAQFRITNYGNVDGFVHIQALSTVLSVAHSLNVYPKEATIEPNSNVVINVSQHLSRDEVCEVTSRHDIRKLATLAISMGDETSRQRLRRTLRTQTSSPGGEIIRFFTQFPCEKEIDLSLCKESKDFEKTFLKTVQSVEILIVFEKKETLDSEMTLLESDDSKNFTTLCDTILVQPTVSRAARDSASRVPSSITRSETSRSASETSKKISDWLQSLP